MTSGLLRVARGICGAKAAAPPLATRPATPPKTPTKDLGLSICVLLCL